MKRFFRILSVFIAILVVPFCYADKTEKIESKSQSENTESTGSIDNQKTFTWTQDSEQDNEDIEQKSNSWELTEAEKIESEKLSKWLNNLLIETYKAKYAVILNNLSNNIKDKKKEERIKILTSLIIAIKPRIDLINSWKVDISENRKEVLLALLSFIVQDTEKRIQSILKEK